MSDTAFHYACRLNSFKARPELYSWKSGPNNVIDLIERASSVKNMDRIVLNYPDHFEKLEPNAIRQAAEQSGMEIDAVNIRFPREEFIFGAFSSSDEALRKKAVDLCKAGIDIAGNVGTDHFVLWLGPDGWDYPFEVDYIACWELLVDSLCQVAEHDGNIRISIEYKPSDFRRISLLNDFGSTMAAVNECGAPNLGLTLDICHLMMANENPAACVNLAQRSGRLFGVHLNDGYGKEDDGLMVGVINPIVTAEIIFYLLKIGYRETIYFDTFPARQNPQEEYEKNIDWVERAAAKINSIGFAPFESAQEKLDAMRGIELARAVIGTEQQEVIHDKY